MFSINLFNQLEPLSIYVVKPIGEVLGCLDNEINESTSSLTVGLNQQYELTFEIHKTEDSIWFDYLQEGMYLLVEKIGLFKMKQPEISLNGYNDTKHITAYSCDVELEDKNCDISINMGTNISQEYLVSDGESEDGYLSYTDSNNDTQYELIKNPYTNLPYDWILLHNTIPAQLSEFKTKYLRGDFGSLVGSERTITSSTQIENFQKYVDVVPRLKHKFEVTSGNGYEEYSITEFLSYTYGSETITKIVVNNEMAFIKRINDLILFYTKYCKQLSLLDIVLEETGGDWTVGDVFGETNIQNIADKFVLSNKKYQFEISESIYSFLTQTFAETANCVVNFDIVNRKVNVTPVEHIGKDSGIVMSYDNLINSMNITCDEENLSTRLYATGADNLSLTRVNYGLEYVEDLGYKMNAKDVNGKRLYVDDALAEKYQNYIDFINAYRTDCIQYSKDIDRINNEINEIKYRVPRDDLKTDWGTFKKDELEEHLTYFKNLLTSLITSYKEDFGTDGCNADDSVNESYMKNTFYWYDYQAYKGIIAEIECAISTFPYYSDQDKWTDTNKSEYLDRIKAWETEWTLYGTIELQNKIDIYKGNMDILAEKSVIRQDATAEKTALDTAKAAYETDKDNLTEAQKQERLAAIAVLERAYNVKYYSIKIWGLADWNSLSAADKSRYLSPQEKEGYGNLSANYYYDEYMKYYNYFIGSVDNAYDYLITLNAQIDSLTDSLETCMESRAELNRQATLSGFTFFGDSPYFSDDDIKAITRLYRDADYSNENILKTDINTTDEVIDICLELLEDAKDQASIVSRPQLTFAVEADNLLGLSDYKAMWSNFKCGNFMLVQYRDNTYVKLRIVAFTFNPRLPSSKDFKIEFSNFTRSRVLISDTSYLLNKATSTSSRSSGSGRGSGNGVFGTSDEIDITISNTMLARLLNSESFGTRVTNVILDTLDVNALTATNATFQGLADGTTTIDGGCITTGSIQSNNYSYNSATGVETGSILRLNDGTLSFGGGKLKWDGSILSVDGAITASSYLSTGGRKSSATGHTGIFIDDAGNLYGGSNNETQIKADGTLSFGGGKISYAYDNNLHDYALSVEGIVTANSGRIGHWDIDNNGMYLKGISLDSEVGFICHLTEKEIWYSNGEYLDKFGFKVHNSASHPYFYYYVRQVSLDANTVGYMLLEEAAEQGMSATSGAVDIIRVYWSQYQGSEILLGKVISTNHSSDLPVDSYCIIEPTETLNVKRGQVRPISEVITSADVLTSVLNSKASFDDDDGDGGDFNNPLYTTAISEDGESVVIPSKTDSYPYTGQNVLLDYTIEGVISGYTYLTSQSLTNSITPIIAIDVKLSSNSPDFSTAKTILYSNGLIKALDIETDYVRSKNVSAKRIDATTFMSNTTSASNYKLYLENSDGFDDNNHIVITSDAAGTLNGNAYDEGVYFGTSNEYCTTYIRGKEIHLYPSNAVYLGKAGGTIVTSDETVKDLYDITSKYESFFNALSPTLYKYKQGGHRLHMGFGARTVKQALVDSNLSTEEFAGVVIEQNKIIPAGVSYSGEDEYYEELYSLRYEEFIALNTHMIQKLMVQVQSLENEIEELKRGNDNNE